MKVVRLLPLSTGHLYPNKYSWYLCRDKVVGIATRYGLDSPEIESRLGQDFTHQPRPALEPTQPPIQGIPGPSRR
jgi:hypothetical protein